MFEELRIVCPFCFEEQDLFVDSGGGENQELVVDCEVCCHPMDIHVNWDEEEQKYSASVDRSGGF